jgi:probable rRNA maturation factor
VSIEVLNESGDDVDITELSRLSRFVMDRMRVHPLAELCIKVVDEPTIAERQAKDAGHSTQDEVDLLTVHGILHLLGYDHAEPEEHTEMFGLQARLLAEWGGARQGEAPAGDEPAATEDSR